MVKAIPKVGGTWEHPEFYIPAAWPHPRGFWAPGPRLQPGHQDFPDAPWESQRYSQGQGPWAQVTQRHAKIKGPREELGQRLQAARGVQAKAVLVGALGGEGRGSTWMNLENLGLSPQAQRWALLLL